MFNLFKKNEQEATQETLNIPKHIAFIMDGNGRWANKRNLPRTAGHKEGSNTMKKIAIHASKLGVQAVTFYAFSTENWKRPQDEIKYLMKLPRQFFDDFMPTIKKHNIKVVFIGDIDSLDQEIKDTINKSVEETKDNTGMTLAIALNYGSQDEIISAVKKVAVDYKNNKVSLDELTPNVFDQYLMTKDLPEIDLMIRTSGEYRLSNFLLWQLAYAEFYFTDVFWPDFKEEQLEQAIQNFNDRNRRFGGLK